MELSEKLVPSYVIATVI